MSFDALLRRVDWILIVTVLLLLAIGAQAVRGTTVNDFAGNPTFFDRRHLTYIAMGLVFAAVVTAIDPRIYRRLFWPIYGATIGLLIVVLGFSAARGSQRWITLPFFTRTTPSTVGDYRTRSGSSQIDNHHAILIEHLRANRHGNDRVDAHRSRAIRTLTIMAILGLQVRVVAHVCQVAQRRLSNQNDAAAISTVATRRAAAGNELLASKGDSSVTPSTRCGIDRRPVGEHGLRPADYPSAGATEMMRLPRR